MRAAKQRYAERNRERTKVYTFKSTYGISTLEEAKEILATKPNQCELCPAEGDICYDHDHKSGKHRGWLCRRCNVALGLCDDDPDLLRRMADYLANADV